MLLGGGRGGAINVERERAKRINVKFKAVAQITTEFDFGNFCSVIDAGITPRGFVSEDANVAHVNKYVQSFEDRYHG